MAGYPYPMPNGIPATAHGGCHGYPIQCLTAFPPRHTGGCHGSPIASTIAATIDGVKLRSLPV